MDVISGNARLLSKKVTPTTFRFNDLSLIKPEIIKNGPSELKPKDNAIISSLTTKTENRPLKVISFVENENMQLASLAAIKTKPAYTLSVPPGYSLKNETSLAEGISYSEFVTGNDVSGKKSVRAIKLDPGKLTNLGVRFTREKIDMSATAAEKDILAVMNGTFFGGIAAGDIKGEEIKKGKIASGSYSNAERGIAPKIDSRYTFAINREGKPEVFRGGLYKPSDISKNGKPEAEVKIALGGGVLLFDGKNSEMYKAAGTTGYNKLLKDNNDTELVENNLGLARKTARSVVGIMADGSVVMVNIGEGRFRKTGGVTPSETANIMKEMGCITAVMYDGGGAPTMKAKDINGKTIADTAPYIVGNDNYNFNKSAIVVYR